MVVFFCILGGGGTAGQEITEPSKSVLLRFLFRGSCWKGVAGDLVTACLSTAGFLGICFPNARLIMECKDETQLVLSVSTFRFILFPPSIYFAFCVFPVYQNILSTVGFW